MPLIGYARVSTDDQATDAQVDVLKAAGCGEIFREHLSGAKASRPELAKALTRIRRGDVLMVARLDRLARSLSHLLSVIAELHARGAHFKSLADPIDTTTPQGRFALQVLGAVAELERALIQERTKDGLRAAKKRGRVIGRALAQARGKSGKHAVKQVDRLLSTQGIDVWEPFPLWIAEAIGASRELLIAMDWTEFDADDQSTLVSSLVTRHGRAQPLLWLSVFKAELAKRNIWLTRPNSPRSAHSPE
jgi:DNA invertase Pin-like site-specific DNA recombinase